MPDKWAQYAVPNDKWAQYAQPGSAPAVAGAGPLGLPSVPGAPPVTQEGFFSSLGHSLGVPASMDELKTYADELNPIKHPVRALVGPAGELGSALYSGAKRSANEIGQAIQAGREGNGYGVAQHAITSVPIIGSGLDKAADQWGAKNYTGAAGTVLGTTIQTAPLVTDPIVGGLKKSGVPVPNTSIGNIVRKAVVGDVNKPVSPGGITPAERYNSARSLGVNLDAADATNSGVLKAVKKVNENSLLGSHLYDATKTANAAALDTSTGKILDSMYKGDRESGGLALQTALRNNQQGLQTAATEGFNSLPGDHPIPGSIPLGEHAQAIAKQQADYQSQFPSLTPRQATSVVGDVSKLGPTPLPKGVEGPLAAKPSNFGTMQQLRSDLLELGRTNPDLVQNQSGGWFKQLAGGADAAMTNASTGLSPADAATFRDANAKWSDMKGTYDDPSNPLYHAVRSSNPSQLYSGIGPKTPEMVRNLETRLGTDIAPLRRGVVEGALKTTNDGSPNFKNFGTQFNRIPADYRAELFTPGQQEMLGHVENVANLLGQDANPSGSAKLGQKIVEGSALLQAPFHPLGAVPTLLQYPIARMMNSPAAVDWMMRQPAQAVHAPALSRLAIPAAGGKKR